MFTGRCVATVLCCLHRSCESLLGKWIYEDECWPGEPGASAVLNVVNITRLLHEPAWTALTHITAVPRVRRYNVATNRSVPVEPLQHGAERSGGLAYCAIAEFSVHTVNIVPILRPGMGIPPQFVEPRFSSACVIESRMGGSR